MKNLRITLQEKQVATKAMRDFAESLVPQIENAIDGQETIQGISIVVKVRNSGKKKVELTVNTERNNYRREVTGEDYYDILPEAFNELEKAIYKHRDILKTKRQKRGRKLKQEKEQKIVESFVDDEPAIPEEPEIKFKKVDRVQMTVDVAIEQLEKVGHGFFLFDDAETGEARVVYIREDGGYGVIY